MASRHGVHTNRMVGWHPRSAVLLAWIEAEIKRRRDGGSKAPQGDLLEEATEFYRLASLQGDKGCNCPCDCWAPGMPDDSGEPGWCDACRMNIHSSDRPRPRPQPVPDQNTGER